MKKKLTCAVFTAVLSAGCQSPAQVPGRSEESKVQIAKEEAEALAKGCRPLKYRGGFIPIVETASGSGSACVVQDFLQRNVRDLIHGRNRGSPGSDGIITFNRAKNLSVDMKGHVASSKPFEDTIGIKTESETGAYLKIANGRVETPGPLSYGIYMGLDLWFNSPTALIQYRDKPEDAPPQYRPWNEPNRYVPWPRPYEPATHYTVENMQITSGGRGVVLVGANNVLRNSVIEVDGHTAVYLYGPGTVVEGNTFIVNLKPDQHGELPAMLKLRDADGAVIRNNRFIVKRSFSRAEAAINLLESKNVLIENNLVEDTKLLVRKDAASTTVERGNQLK